MPAEPIYDKVRAVAFKIADKVYEGNSGASHITLYVSLLLDKQVPADTLDTWTSDEKNHGFVVNKASLLSGGPIVVAAFRGLDNFGGNGIYLVQGVDNDDPAATEGYFIGPGNFSYGQLVIRRISTPGGTPTLSGNLVITVPATTDPIPQAHKGDTNWNAAPNVTNTFNVMKAVRITRFTIF